MTDSKTTETQLAAINNRLSIACAGSGVYSPDVARDLAETKRALLQSLEIQLRLEKLVYHVGPLPGDGPGLRGSRQ
jgi:hypothetical protein